MKSKLELEFSEDDLLLLKQLAAVNNRSVAQVAEDLLKSKLDAVRCKVIRFPVSGR